AIGNTTRRVASNVALSFALENIEHSFFKNQFFNAKAGTEHIIHETRAFFNDNPDKIVLFVDLKNAFNMVKRSAILQAVSTHVPIIFSYVEFLYGTHTKLLSESGALTSQSGLHQGDPIS